LRQPTSGSQKLALLSIQLTMRPPTAMGSSSLMSGVFACPSARYGHAHMVLATSYHASLLKKRGYNARVGDVAGYMCGRPHGAQSVFRDEGDAEGGEAVGQELLVLAPRGVPQRVRVQGPNNQLFATS